MRKLRTTLAAFGLSALFLLVGCVNKETSDQSLMPITEVRATFDQQINKIKSQGFDNFNLEDTYFSFTEADKVYDIEYEKTKFKCSPDEAYDYICKMTDRLIPGMYSDEQKLNEVRFVDCDMISDEDFPFRYPTLEQYKKMGLASDRPHPIIANENCYVETNNEILFGYDRGDMKKRGGYNLDAMTSYETGYGYTDDGRIDMFDMLLAYPIVYRTLNLESEKTFHLETGDISIAEAVKSADKYLSELELSSRELCKIVVQSVNVIDIGNGCYAFCFGVVPEYKQIKFGRCEMDRNVIGINSVNNTTNETNLSGHAVMYKKDDICRCRIVNPLLEYDFKETASHSSVIPLDKAAESVSDYMTAGIKFDVKSVTVTYKEFSDKDHSLYTDTEAYRNRKITVKPCWRFVLKPTKGDTGKLYYAYVDMLSGKIYTIVQIMESEEEYE